MPIQSQTKQREDELDKKLKEIAIKEKEEQYRESAQKLGLPFSTLKGVPIDIEVVNIIPEETARDSGIVALNKLGKKIIVAVLDPNNFKTKAAIE